MSVYVNVSRPIYLYTYMYERVCIQGRRPTVSVCPSSDTQAHINDKTVSDPGYIEGNFVVCLHL